MRLFLAPLRLLCALCGALFTSTEGEKLIPVHEAQLLTYLKLNDCRLGFLLNWNVPLMKDGIKRMVNKL